MKIFQELQIKSVNFGAAISTQWMGSSEIKLDSINPANGELLASITTATRSDYEQVMAEAVKAAGEWRQIPAPKRGDIIRQIGNRLREVKEALGTLVTLEMGKSKQEGLGEVQEMIDMADFAVGQSRMLYGLTMHSERPEHRMYEQWHPYGIVGVISAFNFPVAVWAWNAFLSAICGNVTIWKPSSKTPLCAVAIQHVCNQVLSENNAPPIFGFFIPESHEVAERFISDERVSLISFTGSTKTGRHVAEVVSRRLGKTILELGGNNAIIIDESANLDLAVPAVLFGAVGTAGQRCTSTRRVIVHTALYDPFIQRLRQAYSRVKIGDPLDPKTLMGPLVDQAAVVSYRAAIHTIQQQGGEIAFGGNVLPGPGFFVDPTIVVNVKNEWEIVQTETFAPILYVMKYSRDLTEAIEMQNQVHQGLSSSLFTTDLMNAERFLSVHGSDCGIANINIGTSGAEIGGAFGGEKESGGGRESGSDAWKAYMRRQTNTINWSRELPLAQGIQFSL